MTTETRTDGATILSRANFSGYVGHATIFSRMLTCYVQFSSRPIVRVRIRIGAYSHGMGKTVLFLFRAPIFFTYIGLNNSEIGYKKLYFSDRGCERTLHVYATE